MGGFALARQAPEPTKKEAEDMTAMETADKTAVVLDLWLYERTAWEAGRSRVAGVDEAGRGPLAGPVVAAAAILPDGYDIAGITDSKALTEKKRETAFERIVADAAKGFDVSGVAIGVGWAFPDEVDRINILQATHAAMRRAVANLCVPPDAVLVDGLPVRNLHTHCTAIVKGDALSASIAAASIIAKVSRDRYMTEQDALYPEYGFAKHKGYCAPIHLAALAEHGPCPIHRYSFGPVAQVSLKF
jgi:ribonuclease HII